MSSTSHALGDRFVPRHEDELELEVDDPLLVELQAEDYWYEAYNMRTGARGVFPAYYAIEVTKEPEHMAGSPLPTGWSYPPLPSAHQFTASEHTPQVLASQGEE